MSVKLEIQKLHKSFGSLQVLRDLNFQVADQEFLAIVGPSGCGKTTLLRTIAGIETPDEGQVIIDGRHITKPGADRGFVFQQDSLLPWRTIWKNLVFGLEVNGRLTEGAVVEAKQLLKLVGLSGFESFYPSQMSGGMRQRVNLARALALNPEVLLWTSRSRHSTRRPVRSCSLNCCAFGNGAAKRWSSLLIRLMKPSSSPTVLSCWGGARGG
jgi:NitT/TauT family transport system ATP-binding protein